MAIAHLLSIRSRTLSNAVGQASALTRECNAVNMAPCFIAVIVSSAAGIGISVINYIHPDTNSLKGDLIYV